MLLTSINLFTRSVLVTLIVLYHLYTFVVDTDNLVNPAPAKFFGGTNVCEKYENRDGIIK